MSEQLIQQYGLQAIHYSQVANNVRNFGQRKGMRFTTSTQNLLSLGYRPSSVNRDLMKELGVTQFLHVSPGMSEVFSIKYVNGEYKGSVTRSDSSFSFDAIRNLLESNNANKRGIYCDTAIINNIMFFAFYKKTGCRSYAN